MLEAHELNIKFQDGWIQNHKDHFLSQLMLIEIQNRKVSILYDGGGFSDRNKIMKSVISTAAGEGLILPAKRFYLFTGDNRPGGIEFDHVYFSIAGPRILQNFILPDPYSFSWNDAGVKSYDEAKKQMNDISKKYENNQINKVFWRGNHKQHYSREKFIEYVRGNDIFNVEESNHGQSNFIHMSEVGMFSTLVDFPGQGYSGRLKYLIHANRPIVVHPREEWDLLSMILEPDIHYISSLPSIEDTVQRCMISINNKDVRKYYGNSMNRILPYFSERNSIKLLANSINKWAE